MKAWSHGRRLIDKASDRDAGWCVKTNTEGNKKFVWGYKVHMLADATYELPIVLDVTAGNVHDSQKLTPLLRRARYATNQFWPKHVIADSAYSSAKIRRHIISHYPHTQAIIDPNRAHKKATEQTQQTPEWKAIYSHRTAIERLFGRLKAHRRLNSVRVRGRAKVHVHALLSVTVLQAQALATGCRDSVRKVA